MSKTALVFLAEGFEEIEALAPIDILRRAGVKVTTAAVAPFGSGPEGRPLVKASHSVNIEADCYIADVLGGDFDAVICPGGGLGSKNLAASAEVGGILTRHFRRGAIVAAICAAPAVVLAPLGILDGKRAVCYPGMESEAPSVSFGTARVEKDGNVITSRGAGTAVEFALALVKELVGEETSEKLAQGIVAK